MWQANGKFVSLRQTPEAESRPNRDHWSRTARRGEDDAKGIRTRRGSRDRRVGVVATASATTPKQLYGKLLTTEYTSLPKGFYSAKVGSAALGDREKRHHAVGDVQVTVDSDSAVYFTVFPSRTDAIAYIRDHKFDTSKDVKLVRWTDMGRAPGYKSVPSYWRNLTAEGKNAFGKTVRNGVTSMGVVTQNVLVSVATISTDNEESGDVPATIKLLGSGMKHLAKVRGR